MTKVGAGNVKWIFCLSAIVVICGFGAVAAHGHSHAHDHHDCGHAHHHDEGHHHPEVHNHAHHHEEGHHHPEVLKRQLLPEELAEEEDLKSHGFGSGGGAHQHEDNTELSGLGLWMHAMGCSLLVSLASLICLILLPLIFIEGKPSKTVVDSLALFGAGAMLGDAFLHQLPHAFGSCGEDEDGHSNSPTAFFLVSRKLNGTNYLEWAQTMKLAIDGRGRMGFLTGESKMPGTNDPKLVAWKFGNSMTMASLINSMESTISQPHLFLPTTKDIWEALRRMYSDLENSSQIYDLKSIIWHLMQDTKDVITYYSHIVSLWKELDLSHDDQWECQADSTIFQKREENE